MIVHKSLIAGLDSLYQPFWLLFGVCDGRNAVARGGAINYKSLFIAIFPFKAIQSISKAFKGIQRHSKQFKAIQRYLASSFFYFYAPPPKLNTIPQGGRHAVVCQPLPTIASHPPTPDLFLGCNATGRGLPRRSSAKAGGRPQGPIFHLHF